MSMKKLIALTGISVLAVATAGNALANCGSCAASAPAAKPAAPACCANKASVATKACAAKQGCGMKAALSKLELTAEQNVKIKAIYMNAGCKGDPKACDKKMKRACLKKLKKVLSKKQYREVRKSMATPKVKRVKGKKKVKKAAE
jgi:hypothetical protein